MAEIGEGGGGFGFHMTLRDSGEEASEGGVEIAGGHIVAGKVIGDVLAGGFGSEGLRVLAGVERAEVRMRGARGAAAAAKVNEHKEARTLERLVDMEVSRKKIRFWDFWGASRRRGALLNEKSIPER